MLTLRGRVLDWVWGHPRAKRRAREVWGASRWLARRLHLSWLGEPPEFRDLRRLARSAAPPPKTGERVLILSFRGWSTHVALEAVIGHAVAQSGWTPVFATCGGRLPVCDVMPVHAAPPMPCRSCAEYAGGAIAAAGHELTRLNEMIDFPAATRLAREQVAGLRSVSECERFTIDGLAIGEMVRTSVAWFLARGTLDERPSVLDAYRAFLVSGIVLAQAFDRLLARTRPRRIFALNGRFFAERILLEIARRQGIGFTTYEKGFRPGTVVTAPEGFASDLLIPEAEVSAALERKLSPAEDRRLEAYLQGRRRDSGGLDRLWTRPLEEAVAVRRLLGLEASRPLVAMFCNILWDSAVVGKDLGFPSMGEWVRQGVAWAGRHPDIDLVVRLHPAEVRLTNHRSIERMGSFIRKVAPVLPPNVRVIPAESQLSSYTLMNLTRVGLVYTSSVGLEMAAQGVPVVVAGETHYRGRGFTVDPTSVAAYWEAVESLLATGPSRSERDLLRQRGSTLCIPLLLSPSSPDHISS